VINHVKFKDETLWRLSKKYNVARFLSFDPNLKLRYAKISETDREVSGSLRAVISNLLELCDSVNIRTFLPSQASGNPFVYGLTSADLVLEKMYEFSKLGYFCLVNETISINDGGVSGVVDQGIVEFSPDDTPRAVEKPGVCALSFDLANHILSTVYEIRNPIPFQKNQRVEFSLHPNRVGVRNEQVLVWESTPSQLHEDYIVVPNWPNNFSRHIGDKVFGLLIADAIGLAVPHGTVVGRRIAPFIFGQPTVSHETWIRTCPTVQEPGKYTTTKSWLDPFALMHDEDPENTNIQALIFQNGVHAEYSGATLSSNGKTIIEGIAGTGEAFMSGSKSPEPLPTKIIDEVEEVLMLAETRIGAPVRIEWVHDGKQVWIVQMHIISSPFIEQGKLKNEQILEWVDFDPESGIAELNRLIEIAKGNRSGIRVTRPTGITSHVGDLLRKNSIPFILAAVKDL